MTLQIGKIYKVKEGHEGNCFYYRAGKGSYIQIIDKNNKDEYFFKILDDNKEFLNVCDSCFTEDDLELEEEVKEKSLEDLEVGDEVINLDGEIAKIKDIYPAMYVLQFDGKQNQFSLKTLINDGYKFNNIRHISPSEAETLLEEKLGIKVKIK